MNENFLGKYSVFCVFGSVVGCVVVPLIAQVVQQQSVECMILSAIVITLTATRLKKCGSDSQHSKMIMSKEFERRKLNNSIRKHRTLNGNFNVNSNNNNHHGNSSNVHHIQQQQQPHQQDEEEYMQKQLQHENLKITEMERRNEEKRLRKLKKREEKLRKKDEENRKEKENEEKYKLLKEKRRNKHKENENGTSFQHVSPSVRNNLLQKYDKYICGEETYGTNRKPEAGPRVVNENCSSLKIYQNNRHRIPRFNNTATNKNKSNSRGRSSRTLSSMNENDSLSISCSNSNLSASCSSLSSISSSGSSSSPPPISPLPFINNFPSSAWKGKNESLGTAHPDKFFSDNGKTVAHIKKDPKNTTWLLDNKGTCEEVKTERVAMKSYSSFRPGKKKVYNFNSSSLFCTNPGKERKNTDINTLGDRLDEEVPYAGKEYSLFGSHQFGRSFLKSPII